MSPVLIFYNQILLAALISWGIAQAIKVPLHYTRTRKLDWSLLFLAGGMPSSHSALVAGLAHSLGLYLGFDSPFFAIGLILSLIVIYDATGIRRQAGIHASTINRIIADLADGHPPKDGQLKEVLGHTPMEALVGTILGILLAQIMFTLLR